MARLRALFFLWVGWASRSGLPGGCPFVAAATEVDDCEGTLREHVEQMQSRWFRFFQSVVEQAMTCGHLSGQVDPTQFTWEIFGIYLVYHFSSRLLRDPQAEDRAHQAFERLLQAPPLRAEGLS